MTAVKMEVGKTYTTASGKERIKIVAYRKGGRYRWEADNGMTYTRGGQIFYSMPDKEDLVRQVD